MERLNFRHMAALQDCKPEEKAEAVEAVVRDLTERALLTEAEASAVSYRKILNFFNSDIGARAANAEILFKEVSFNIRKELSGEKIIIQGTIDCYFKENGKYVLLDYKSNYVGRFEQEQAVEQIVEEYRTQLALYKEALEKIRQIEIEEAYLYLFSIDRAVRVF